MQTKISPFRIPEEIKVLLRVITGEREYKSMTQTIIALILEEAKRLGIE